MVFLQKPGAILPSSAAAARHVSTPKGARRGTAGKAIRTPTLLVGIGLLAFIVFLAVFAHVISPGSPFAMVGPPLLWPGQDLAYPLGTDALGRDLFAGVLYGARVSLLVGIAATVLGVGMGVLIGATAGYFGGWIDDFIVRVIEIFQTIPSFVLLVVLVAIAQPSVTTVIIGIALVSWDAIARLTRAEVRSLRQKEFVTAARSVGFSDWYIIRKEILPNVLPPIVVAASLLAASAILLESALSFMGLGDPNVVSRGKMIGTGRELLRTHWYLTAVPGLLIITSVLALNLIGDGLNDVLNPRRNT